MAVHARLGSRRCDGLVQTQEVSRGGHGSTGPTSVTLSPPAGGPPSGPRATSQALPSTSAARAVAPAAASASVRERNVSIRQKSGPWGQRFDCALDDQSNAHFCSAAAECGTSANARNVAAQAISSFGSMSPPPGQQLNAAFRQLRPTAGLLM